MLAGSNPASATGVCVRVARYRIVSPDHAGSNPVVHPGTISYGPLAQSGQSRRFLIVGSKVQILRGPQSPRFVCPWAHSRVAQSGQSSGLQNRGRWFKSNLGGEARGAPVRTRTNARGPDGSPGMSQVRAHRTPYSLLAQLAERRPVKALVPGSSPGWGAGADDHSRARGRKLRIAGMEIINMDR